MKTFQPDGRLPAGASLCTLCVYFIMNLEETESVFSSDETDPCGLGFEAGDEGCAEMRTENCSMRKRT